MKGSAVVGASPWAQSWCAHPACVTTHTCAPTASPHEAQDPPTALSSAGVGSVAACQHTGCTSISFDWL